VLKAGVVGDAAPAILTVYNANLVLRTSRTNCRRVAFADTPVLYAITAAPPNGQYGCFDDADAGLRYCPPDAEALVITFYGANFGDAPRADDVCTDAPVNVSSTSFLCVLKKRADTAAALDVLEARVNAAVTTAAGATSNAKSVRYSLPPVVERVDAAACIDGDGGDATASGGAAIVFTSCPLDGSAVAEFHGRFFGPNIGGSSFGTPSLTVASLCDLNQPYTQTSESHFACVIKATEMWGGYVDAIATTFWGSASAVRFNFMVGSCHDARRNGLETGRDCGDADAVCAACGQPTLYSITTTAGCQAAEAAATVTECAVAPTTPIRLTFTGSQFAPDVPCDAGSPGEQDGMCVSAAGATAPDVCLAGSYLYPPFQTEWTFSCLLVYGAIGRAVDVAVHVTSLTTVTTPGDAATNSTATTTSSVVMSNALQITYAQPSCDDFTLNNGEEEIDCGGANCGACETRRPVLMSITVNAVDASAAGCKMRAESGAGVYDCPQTPAENTFTTLTFTGRHFGTDGTAVAAAVCASGTYVRAAATRDTRFTCLLKAFISGNPESAQVTVTTASGGESVAAIVVAYETNRPVVFHVTGYAPCVSDGRGGLSECGVAQQLITFHGVNFKKFDNFGW
jgi:hypothetical protein